MKGKRHTTEDKIRILRAADGGKSIVHQPKPKTNIASGPVFGTRSPDAPVRFGVGCRAVWVSGGRASNRIRNILTGHQTRGEVSVIRPFLAL